MQQSEKGPKAFISYSWDSEMHKAWVRTFAEELVKNGVKVTLDQWHLIPGQSVTQFMEMSIHNAEFILVVCTPKYARRSNARLGGVGYEQQIISAQIAQQLKGKRFVPILRSGTLKGARNNAMPTHLSGIYALDFRLEEKRETEFEDLIRAIFAQPRFRPPPLGEGPIFDARPSARARKEKSTSVRLPNCELDGYELRSGVASAELNPDTFHIPSGSQRAKLSKGDIVKLSFIYADDLVAKLEGMAGERMWVKIHAVAGGYYVGKLVSQPLAQDEEGWPLTWGDRVLFLAEHVIAIE